jgi:lambda family phage portal protein
MVKTARDIKGKAASKVKAAVSYRPRMDVVKQVGYYNAYGYQSVRVAIREGRSAVGGHADRHLQYDRPKSINQSREFLRDNGIYRGMIERSVSYIIGNGFALQAKTPDADLNRQIELMWSEWWKRPEFKGILSGSRVERMICRELLVAGDVGVIKTDQQKLQLIEAEQIASRNTVDGIAKDEFGAPIGIYVAPYGRNGSVDLAAAKSYKPIDEILFVTDPDRPSGLRGMPACQSAFSMLHRINDVCDSEAVAWQMLARMAIAVTREGGPEMGYTDSISDPEKTAEGNLADRMSEVDYALIFHGQPGESVKGIERNIPGQNFSESLIMFLRMLGLPMGLPLELILLDWTKSNYSQSRAVLEQAYQTFLGWQELIEVFFHTPVFEWKLNEWLANGSLILPSNIGITHEWIRPTFPWIDQLKEAEAYGAKVDRGFATHSQVCKSLNVEREDVVSTREQEIRDAIARSTAIEADTGVVVPWQHFCGLSVTPPKPLPQEIQVNA